VKGNGGPAQAGGICRRGTDGRFPKTRLKTRGALVFGDGGLRLWRNRWAPGRVKGAWNTAICCWQQNLSFGGR